MARNSLIVVKLKNNKNVLFDDDIIVFNYNN